ncbi:hypothetical protein PG996_015923 [Apiospora saccharicola]|uniref:Uncharacterized protein n=1 Tax=Apiospora saccharicola TaxID=335842 RepID=A0ABR1TMK8_9PEZI
MPDASPPDVQPPVGFEHLATETQLQILNESGLVTPHKRVYWATSGFFVCVPIMEQRYGRLAINHYFLASRAVRNVAIQVFYANNEFVVEPAQPTLLTMAPAANFLNSIVPRQGLTAMKSLGVDIQINDPDWRQVVASVAGHMESLERLTIVARYDVDDTVYDFGKPDTLDALRTLVDEKVWPVLSPGQKFKQLVVHIHSRAGSSLAGRDSRAEPTYFLERKDFVEGIDQRLVRESSSSNWDQLPHQSSFYQYIINNNGLVRDIHNNEFFEGMIKTSDVEHLIEGRF